MSESVPSTLISALPAASSVSDTDIVVLENGSTTQKITIAQLKEALGINALNTNLKGIICTVAEITGSGNNYFYVGKKSGISLIGMISISDASVYITGISCDNSNNGVYTIRVSKNLTSGAIYSFVQLWVKVGLNA